MAGRKPGRPTTNPKIHELKVRLDKGTMQILNAYAEQTGRNRAQCVREAIALLKNEETPV